MTVEKMSQANTVVVKATMGLPKIVASWENTYTVYGSGDIIVQARFLPNKKDLPKLVRVGLQMTMPAGFERITWLGPGPQETYTDRKDAKVDVYSGRVEDQFFADYTETGETGNKADARWVSLTKGNVGLLVVGMPLLSVNALHYGTEDLNAAKHAFELPHRDYITVNIDLKQQGVGGDNSWGAWPHEPFLIPCQEYSYNFRLRPFTSGEEVPKLARQLVGNVAATDR
jgi:beta-galactosidase